MSPLNALSSRFTSWVLPGYFLGTSGVLPGYLPEKSAEGSTSRTEQILRIVGNVGLRLPVSWVPEGDRGQVACA